VHVTAVCPFCQVSYQVQPTLRGQPIRCPNGACRKVFVVGADLPEQGGVADSAARAASQAPANGSRSGSVGELVPILPASAAPAPAPEPPGSKHVGEMVPLVPAEPAVPPPPAEAPSWALAPPPLRRGATPPEPPPPPAPAAPPAPSWQDAPPPVRGPQGQDIQTPPPPRRRRPPSDPVTPPPVRASQAPPTRKMVAPFADERGATPTMKMPVPLPADPEQPRELPPGVWEPPPVRRGPDAPTDTSTTLMPSEPAVPRPRVSKRKAYLLSFLLLFGVFGILGAGGWWLWQTLQKTEDQLLAEANTEYQEGKFGSAASKYKDLEKKFPQSAQLDLYRFLAELSGLRGTLHDSHSGTIEGTTAALGRLDQFLKEHKGDPLLVSHAHDLGTSLVKLTASFTEQNSQPTSDAPLETVGRLRQARQEVAALDAEALTAAEKAQIEADLGKVQQAVEQWQWRQKLLAELNAPAPTPFAALERARRLVKEKTAELPGINNDADVQAALARLQEAHLASVKFEPAGEEPVRAAAPGVDTEPSLLFDPLQPGRNPGPAPDKDPVVLSLYRGVLYALKQSNGAARWAMRVGADTTSLPVAVPASKVNDQLFLVLSADTQALTALNADGVQVWKYRLGSSCLGRPLVLGRFAYLPTYDGIVHEIELANGGLVGRYNLGQPLTVGGAPEPGSNRLYFPADDSCVYVLDVSPDARRCATILYTGHPAGSVRSEPIVIPAEEGRPGYLVLNQTHGMHATELRVFPLPGAAGGPEGPGIQNAALQLDPRPEVRGWTRFAPYHDGEKIALLSDTATFGLFGIRQPRNEDQALFPLVPPAPLTEEDGRRAAGQHSLSGRAALSRARSQVVDVQGDDYWLIALGRLRRVQYAMTRNGPRLVPGLGWKEPLSLGSPVHASQVHRDRLTGHSTLFLVTQPLQRDICLASAVDSANGALLWQRQLGMLCQGEPLLLTVAPGKSPLLVLDRGGGLFVLDPARYAAQPAEWQSGGKALAPALDENPRLVPFLLSNPDGRSACEIACPGDGRNLVIRHVLWDDEDGRLRVKERTVPLPSPLAGTPALVGASLVLPTAEGSLIRLALIGEDDRFRTGPTWRMRRAGPVARGHVLALGGDRFLTTDGARGLTCWSWPGERPCVSLPADHEPPTLEMTEHLTGPPLLLPPTAGVPQVLVADAAGVLSLLTVENDGSLKVTRSWKMPGSITGGPFVHVLPDGKMRVGCVLDGTRLVWLDPASKDVLWVYDTKGKGIVGRPQVAEGMLVVADQDGRFVGLDLATGKPLGPGYKLRGTVVPVATPVAFSPGRLFAPLSDGTALLLAVEHLKKR
jgi:outer membrane protein assembly factor BamB